MKKLITIALLTLSTFSLMAEFPVRTDNFDVFSKGKDWIESEFLPMKSKCSNYIFGNEFKIDGKSQISFYYKDLKFVVFVYENEDGEKWAYVKDFDGQRECFSNHSWVQEIRGDKFYGFKFEESEVEMVIAKSSQGWMLMWKIWQEI